MVQKEVAERLACKSGSKDYGIITIMLDFYGKVKIMRNVSRKMFTPMPNVDSSVVKIQLEKNKYNCNKVMFSKIVHGAFSMRRKTLLNNLSAYLNMPKQQVANWLSSAGIDPQKRAEQLSINDYVKLTNSYFEQNRQN